MSKETEFSTVAPFPPKGAFTSKDWGGWGIPPPREAGGNTGSLSQEGSPLSPRQPPAPPLFPPSNSPSFRFTFPSSASLAYLAYS